MAIGCQFCRSWHKTSSLLSAFGCLCRPTIFQKTISYQRILYTGIFIHSWIADDDCINCIAQYVYLLMESTENFLFVDWMSAVVLFGNICMTSVAFFWVCAWWQVSLRAYTTRPLSGKGLLSAPRNVLLPSSVVINIMMVCRWGISIDFIHILVF